jgi:hypothetical protein
VAVLTSPSAGSPPTVRQNKPILVRTDDPTTTNIFLL